ncbi:hypothetical protein B0J14DRAFT_599047 [Halenospora varia]|nr:hypothetical protein B0J14DRAFT_599047 [Halenospora varia]
MALRPDKGKGKAVVYSGPTDSKGGAIFMGDQNAGRDINITTFTTIRPAARETYLKCLSSSELFQPLASELASLMTVLQLAEENAFQTKNSRVWDFRTKITTLSPMSFGYDVEMRTIMNGCHAVLSDIKKLLQEYDDLPSQAQSTWTRIEWDGARISDLRARLTSNVTMLSVLNTSIMMSSQASVKQMLQKFIQEVRSGQRIGSVLSRQMGKPLAFNNQEAWHQIQKELQDVGITSEIFVEHQHLIVSSIKKAVSGGGLTDLPEELLLLEPVDDEVVFPKIESRNSYLGLRRPNEMSKDSELIQKAERGDIVRLTQLLQEGKDVDHRGENGETALMRIVMMISHTPKIFDINHALTLLRSSMDVEKSSHQKEERQNLEICSKTFYTFSSGHSEGDLMVSCLLSLNRRF